MGVVTPPHVVAMAALLFLLFFTLAHSATEEEFELYSELEGAFTNNSLALYNLRKLFFPPTGAPGRLCSPIQYQLSCNGNNISFLWTQYDTDSLVGQILVSFAYYGVVLRGFNWEQYCKFYRDKTSVFIKLDVPPSFDCNVDVYDQLLELTTTVRLYDMNLSIGYISLGSII